MMKRIYSIILLLAFSVGIIQPIMPMIEYQLSGGNLINILNSESAEQPDGPLLIIEASILREKNGVSQDLLDDSYYPLGIQLSAPPEVQAFPHEESLEVIFINYIPTRSYTPAAPPPRLS